MLFTDLKKKQKEQGMLCIDIFTKYALVLPITSKTEDDTAAGILQCLNERKEKPEIVYTAGETSFDSYALRDYFKETKPNTT